MSQYELHVAHLSRENESYRTKLKSVESGLGEVSQLRQKVRKLEDENNQLKGGRPMSRAKPISEAIMARPVRPQSTLPLSQGSSSRTSYTTPRPLTRITPRSPLRTVDPNPLHSRLGPAPAQSRQFVTSASPGPFKMPISPATTHRTTISPNVTSSDYFAPTQRAAPYTKPNWSQFAYRQKRQR